MHLQMTAEGSERRTHNHSCHSKTNQQRTHARGQGALADDCRGVGAQALLHVGLNARDDAGACTRSGWAHKNGACIAGC